MLSLKQGYSRPFLNSCVPHRESVYRSAKETCNAEIL